MQIGAQRLGLRRRDFTELSAFIILDNEGCLDHLIFVEYQINKGGRFHSPYSTMLKHLYADLKWLRKPYKYRTLSMKNWDTGNVCLLWPLYKLLGFPISRYICK